jgi:HEAT repeat protein
MTVLFRIVNREVERIRIYSAECQLDAGGRAVTWLSGVHPADSIALLESMIAAGQGSGKNRIADGALAAMALHRDPAADGALERLVGTSIPASVRSKVPFWLGHARGASGLAMLQRLIKDDPLPEVRKKAVFGISRSQEPGAVDLLVQQARTHADPAIRGEAIFWLAQKAGSKAAAAITERIEQDPETDVKKRAVFALSQLPPEDGVPRLLQLARTHSNPAVRKQAIFWLGQSKDPRALDFFAEVLR